MNGSILNNDLALSDIFNPDLFLVAFKVYSAQKQNVSVDELALFTTFEKSSIGGKCETMKVRGLLLQGCNFSNKRLDDKEGSGSSAEYEILPVCYMTFMPKSEIAANSELISVPLFTDFSREKLIADVSLPFSGSKSGLIIKSVALAISP